MSFFRLNFRHLKVITCLILALTYLATPRLFAKDLAGDLFKKVKPPTSEWKVGKDKKGDKVLGVKDKMKAVNVGLKIQVNMPVTTQYFLEQVRSRIISDPGYGGAEVTLINSQNLNGSTWDYFVIKRKDQVNQEFWARSLNSDQILMVLYTALGNYYPQYHEDFQKILEQASLN
ncbi:MAG: hypothetical protein U1F66_11100 [bacterium]